MALDIKLQRSKKNPILGPTDRWWENKLVSNAGVLQLGGKVYLLYTAHGEDGIARLGYARLKNIDEVEERLPYPIFVPEEWFESTGVEDPRLIVIDDRVFMLYAGKEKDWARVCEAHIFLKDFYKIF